MVSQKTLEIQKPVERTLDHREMVILKNLNGMQQESLTILGVDYMAFDFQKLAKVTTASKAMYNKLKKILPKEPRQRIMNLCMKSACIENELVEKDAKHPIIDNYEFDFDKAIGIDEMKEFNKLLKRKQVKKVVAKHKND